MSSRLVILTALAALLADACGGSHAATRTRQAEHVYLAFDGFSLAAPAGWQTGVSRNDDGAAYLTAASNPVDDHEAALGIGSQEDMGPNDVLVSVAEVENPPDAAGFQPLHGVPHVSRDQLGAYAVPAPAMSIEDYTEGGRYFQIGVAFGRSVPTDEQFRVANEVLSSLTVRPA